VLLSAQANTMGNNNETSVTGCLMKGIGNGYYIKGENGTTYELWGSKNLGEHVNHKVTVSGMEQKMPASMEKKHEMHEKAEAAGGTSMDLKVSNVKMISESCQ